MRFIHVWSYICANYLMAQLKENHEKRRVYYYGFQIVIGAMVKGVLLVAVTLLLGTLLPTLFIVLVFGSLRMLAGGYHMDTYGKCILVSLAMFVLLGVVSQYTYTYWSLPYLMAFVMLSLIIGFMGILKWAPKDTHNRPITDPDEIKKFRKLSFVYLILWTIIITVLLYFKTAVISTDTINIYITAACFGLILEIFTISPAGYRFFDTISGKISTAKTS